jgi:hypothetical protein
MFVREAHEHCPYSLRMGKSNNNGGDISGLEARKNAFQRLHGFLFIQFL